MISSLAAVSVYRPTQEAAPEPQPASAAHHQRSDAGVMVNLSMSGSAMEAVDDMFNLGQRRSGGWAKKLTRDEQDQVFKIVSELLKSGYVGYEWLRVGNKIERHDVDMQMGDSRLRNARPYREPTKQTSFTV